MADTVIQNKKFIKAGNSFAITIDRAFVDRFFDEGRSPVVMELDKETGRVSFVSARNLGASKSGEKLSKAEKSAVLESKLPQEFREWVEKSLDEDSESMKALANL
ncbi:MAG: hypothetical protein ABI758_01575 [Candidatus Woesebacteria bacterium]